MNQRRERRFDHRASEVAAARHFVAETFATWCLVDDDARIAVSELATNAVQHAEAPFTVRITRLPSQIRVEVADDNTLLPAPAPASDDAERGRGLLIVQAVTTAWGVYPTAYGKRVWFTVSARPTTQS
ncbi:MAG TPA: ATP-binding protein [Thermoleophilia bacterium]|nr:ATP-binding protein [Thermoleophilia bacterium]